MADSKIDGLAELLGSDTASTDHLVVFDTSSGTTKRLSPGNLVGLLNATFSAGDIIYHNGTNLVRLAKGTADQILAMNSGATAPEWVDGGWPTPDYTSSGSASTFATDTDFTFTHGLGDYPAHVEIVMRCATAEHGFAVNDRSILHPMHMFWDGTDAGLKMEMDTTQIRIRTGVSIRVLDDSGNRQTITPSNFEFWVNAWA
jgi:hypothetical protein